jgi:hypothetical protein
VQLIASRRYPFLDIQSLVEHEARDTLLRTKTGAFLLHLSSRDGAPDDDRLIRLDCRSALMWLSAPPDDFGIEWD